MGNARYRQRCLTVDTYITSLPLQFLQSAFLLFVNTFSVLLRCTESVNNKDITSRYEEAAALSRFLFFPPLTLPLTFYLRQHIICSLSVHTVCRFRASRDAAITQRNEHVSKLLCWYPYLWRGFYSLRPGLGRAAGSFAPRWQVHHHPPVTLASRDDAGFVLRRAHLGMFGSVLIDMIILNVSAQSHRW